MALAKCRIAIYAWSLSVTVGLSVESKLPKNKLYYNVMFFKLNNRCSDMKRAVHMRQQVPNSSYSVIGMRNGQCGFMCVTPGPPTSYPAISFK